ncbi:MAG: hypothetical protein DWI00_07025 [Planctomycetota bacterium]|nr:MAG: hypothetical protein DWI00_07025 [Planctomycetota bacterium]
MRPSENPHRRVNTDSNNYMLCARVHEAEFETLRASGRDHRPRNRESWAPQEWICKSGMMIEICRRGSLRI